MMAFWPKTALVVQALKTLKQDHVDDRVLAALRAGLNASERTRAAREARYATSWVYEVIKRLAAEEGEPHA
jgi:gamma-glutamyl:cysteine ligase YbdK (ATP-grasp superfamily)